MKYAYSSSVVTLLASSVAAFPTLVQNEAWSPLMESLSKRQVAAAPQGAGAMPLTPPPFDPKLQYVSNTGTHQFVAPTASDERGECPGLNALANHGYLPHTGRATIQQFITGTFDGLGMANDLASFLAVYGAVVDGNGQGWSIGGVPHTGILGSHGNYETDSSPLKSDLNQYGSNGKLIMSQFNNLYSRQPSTGPSNYNLEVLRDFRAARFQESIQKNPYFFYGPFNGVAVSQAAFTFIYRFMSNKSAEAPEGILTRDTLKSFMSISGPENNLVWTPGHERIPDNWYKRHPVDSYSIPYFQTDLVYLASTHPEILTVGNGAYTAQSLAQNPVCFGAQMLAAGANVLLGLPNAAGQLQTALSGATNLGGGCPKITNPDFSQLKACPGFSMYGGPTGNVAPGA